ncbi:GIY-YIG nuclease family protein [Dyella silvatica]|uniref:GIY-YIG nuclease family protein n=1 Tax=Dyella silvatica TaxID=2992128 RepID=UPI00224FE5B5|nr:GIY-YIG nuclease family protein [Dyella silvatica]
MNRTRRKELTLAYKNTPPPMGIFCIRNLASGKMLIDQSTHLAGSLNRHRMELQLGTHRNKALLADWQNYGQVQFAFEVLEAIPQHPEPDFDYASELARRLRLWRARIPQGSAGSYL